MTEILQKFTATIDAGNGGKTFITAATPKEAMAEAAEWAVGGDWRIDGTVLVRVFGEDGRLAGEETVAVKKNCDF